MSRPRLRSPNGCLRCKIRHVKCNLARPRCGFCARWGLTCLWPGDAKETLTPAAYINPEQLQPSKGRSLVELDKPSQLFVVITPSAKPFGKLPLTESTPSPQVELCLRNFFGAMVDDAVPFNIAVDRARMARGWMELIMSDEGSCCALISYAARYQSQGGSQGDLQRLSLEYEASTLSILRTQIEKRKSVTEGTILAAAVHLVAVALDMHDDSQLQAISRGIRCLLSTRGGYVRAMAELKSSTVQSVTIADTLVSLITAQAPHLRLSFVAIRPLSFNSLLPTSETDETMHLHFDAAVVNLFQDLRCLLYFRKPSQQSRPLSSEESKYLYTLLQIVDHKLCTLQAIYIKKTSMSRIAVIAAILVKQQVIAEQAQHKVLIQRLLHRLQVAIITCEAQDLDFLASLTIWASLVALTADGLDIDRNWFLKLIVSLLLSRAGDSQDSPQTMEQLRTQLSCFLWHDRIDRKFRAVYESSTPFQE